MISNVLGQLQTSVNPKGVSPKVLVFLVKEVWEILRRIYRSKINISTKDLMGEVEEKVSQDH